jgi:hypothetical protein
MANLDAEEQQFQKEVEGVKQWWSGSRWRFTQRPFSAEEIVAKRGTLKLTYPSNSQAKKMWDIVEGRFKVGCSSMAELFAHLLTGSRTRMRASHMDVSTRSWSPRWQNISTRSMSLDGNVRQLPPRRMSRDRI